MNSVIKVQNLAKKYVIRHEERERYTALRDVIARRSRRLVQRIVFPFSREKTAGIIGREDLWALKDISFEVAQGESLGIIGRNGAGKSTLLKILSRITEPTEGRVTLRGRVASLLEVGTGFHPELTGRENIFLNGAILGMMQTEIRARLDEIVSFAEIEKFLDTPVKRYSSGMYMRLAFAVAAHMDPEILLVDEVLAVGDAQFQKKCLGKMGEVSRGGRTVLFVSHNMPSIQLLCSRVLLIEGGQIKRSGAPATVISTYLSSGLEAGPVEINLIGHTGRRRSQEPALSRAWILNEEGVQTSSVMMDESVTIEFKFSCSRQIRNPGVGFGIEDQSGARIFSLNNYIACTGTNNFSSLRGGIASFHIPNLMLLPGTYHVSLSLVEDQCEWIDFVERAIAFTVQPFDVYGSGKLLEPGQGVVFVRGNISIEPTDGSTQRDLAS
jgi:lipopolysaccharide transport system ATP-binding protein